jgi:phosphatidylserine decarboxylase
MILKEGAAPVAIAAIAAGVAHLAVGPAASLPLLGAVGYLTWLYWERRPPMPGEPKAVLSPVRGAVVEIAEDRDPWLDRDVLRIRIRVPFPGIVPIRAPIEGKVMELYTAHGMLGRAQRPCAPGESPDCYAAWLRTDEGEDLICDVSSGWSVSRARLAHPPGERVGHGKLWGFVYFASVVDVLAPAGSVARTRAGDRVEAGASALAQLPRS